MASSPQYPHCPGVAVSIPLPAYTSCYNCWEQRRMGRALLAWQDTGVTTDSVFQLAKLTIP